jgi:hypothetical protein
MARDVSPKGPIANRPNCVSLSHQWTITVQRRQASLTVIQGTSLRLGSRASCAFFKASPLRTHKGADARARGKFAAWRDVVIGFPDHAGSPQGRRPRAQPAASSWTNSRAGSTAPGGRTAVSN